jgi:hypothetical protein
MKIETQDLWLSKTVHYAFQQEQEKITFLSFKNPETAIQYF